MTAATADWAAAPVLPGIAAPLRAVDTWHAEQAAAGLTISARVTVRGDDPNLRGHFPGLPIYPGVFIIETICQAMALAIATPLALRSVRSVRFLAPALGGDTLTVAIAASPRQATAWDVTAEAVRGDGTVAARVRADFESRGAGHD